MHEVDTIEGSSYRGKSRSTSTLIRAVPMQGRVHHSWALLPFLLDASSCQEPLKQGFLVFSFVYLHERQFLVYDGFQL
jgi:hypothetical protein